MTLATCDVIFHRLARARRWSVKEGGEQLAERFCHDVNDAIERIAAGPESWAIFRQEYRWVGLDHFPYVIYYRVLDESRVIVLAVAHGARRPGYWLGRTKS